MKKTAFLFSSALLATLIAVLAMMYSPNMVGLVIAIISAVLATISFYCANVDVFQRSNERNNQKMQVMEKMQTIYSDLLHENTNVISQIIAELEKQQLMHNECLLTAINTLETSIREISASHSEHSIEQNEALLKTIEMVRSDIIQESVSGKTAQEINTEKLTNAINEAAKCVEGSNQSVREQISAYSCKVSQVSSDVAERLFAMIEISKTGNENAEGISRNVQAVSTQLKKMNDNFLQQLKSLAEKYITENERLENICSMLLNAITNQDRNNSLLTEISETVATDATFVSSFDKAIRKIDRLIDDGKQVNDIISDATEDMETSLAQLRETLLASDESLKNSLERFVAEYGRISNMDAQLIEKVLARK